MDSSNDVTTLGSEKITLGFFEIRIYIDHGHKKKNNRLLPNSLNTWSVCF